MSLDYFRGDTCEIEVGHNSFIAHRSFNNLIYAICIDDIPLLGFRFEGNNLLLTIYVFDRDNDPLMIVHDNELVYSTETWDIEFEGNTLSIRRGAGDFIFQVSFEPPSKLRVTRGEFFLNGASVRVSEKWVYTSDGIRVSGSTALFTSGGIVVGENKMGLSGIARGSGGNRLAINQSQIYTTDSFPYPVVAPFIQPNKPQAP